jgi:hypothetical protein
MIKINVFLVEGFRLCPFNLLVYRAICKQQSDKIFNPVVFTLPDNPIDNTYIGE